MAKKVNEKIKVQRGEIRAITEKEIKARGWKKNSDGVYIPCYKVKAPKTPIVKKGTMQFFNGRQK